MKKKAQYYSLDKILEKKAHYNILIGQRSNGKTYAVLKYCLEHYFAGKGKFAILRRWQIDVSGVRGQSVFSALVANGIISKLSNGQWSDVYYYGGRWYLCRNDDKGKREIDESPFAYAFPISQMEHFKSTSFPDITTIFFDEFLTREAYLPNEFVLFMNTLSTIIRERNNVKIFMCGNTVNQYSPYFNEFGLTNIKNMKPGDIDVYRYGNSELVVAVEFTDNPAKSKPSDFYFAFDNPALNMVTGKGQVWEMAIYPHLPYKYAPKDIQQTYFIKFDGHILQCEIVFKNDCLFTYIHRKTTPIQDPDNDIIFSFEDDPRPNWNKYITRPTTPFLRRIADTFNDDSVFYQDNETGEIVRNYLQNCK